MIRRYGATLLLAASSICASESPKHLEAHDLIIPKVCTLFRSDNKQIDSLFNSRFIGHIIAEYIGSTYRAYFTHPKVKFIITCRLRPFFPCKNDYESWNRISKIILGYYGHDYTKDASHEFYCEANYSPQTGLSFYSIHLKNYHRIVSSCLTDNYKPLALAIVPKNTYISGISLTALYTATHCTIQELRLLELNFRTGTIMSEKTLAKSTDEDTNYYKKFLTGRPHGLKFTADSKLYFSYEKYPDAAIVNSLAK